MKPLFSLLAASALCVASLFPANAVVLEQKWQAGEKLNYNVNLDGTLNLGAEKNAPVMWAGMPLDVEVQGRGVALLDTLRVQPNGAGVVALKWPALTLKGAAFGQKLQWTAKDGRGLLTMNGKVLSSGKPGELMGLTDPKLALRISKDGKLVGFEPVKPAPLKDETPAETDKPTDFGGAIDQGAFIQSMILRSLPALWPGRDVKDGEEWTAQIGWPSAPGAPEELPVGTFDLQLKGTETVNEKSLQRVTLDGSIQIDEARAKIINDGTKAAMKPGDKPTGTLDNLSQKVRGDLWFDANAGKIVRAQLILDGRVNNRTAEKDGQAGKKTWSVFTGTLNAQLQEK